MFKIINKTKIKKLVLKICLSLNSNNKEFPEFSELEYKLMNNPKSTLKN